MHNTVPVHLEKEEEEADMEENVNVTATAMVSSKQFKLNPVDKHSSGILNKSILLREKRESDNSDLTKMVKSFLFVIVQAVEESTRTWLHPNQNSTIESYTEGTGFL